MSELSREYQNLYNPALGATILFRFSEGYSKKSNEGVPLPLLFVVLPMIFQERSLAIIAVTNVGLRKFVNRFSEKEYGMTDSILSFPLRVDEMLELSKKSLQIALLTKMLILMPSDGILFPGSYKKFDVVLSSDVEKMLQQAKKFGSWCSQLSLFEIENMLRVEF